VWLNCKCGNGSDSMWKEQTLEGMCKDLKIYPSGLQCTNDTLEKITRHMLKQMQLFLNDGIKIKLVAFGDFQSLIIKRFFFNNHQF
jgi:nucleoid DNA-binding protein